LFVTCRNRISSALGRHDTRSFVLAIIVVVLVLFFGQSVAFVFITGLKGAPLNNFSHRKFEKCPGGTDSSPHKTVTEV
jgi:hypothetical protein